MTNLPPLLRDQRSVDADHLKLLAVFHFVLAGLSVIGILFLFAHWFFLHTLLENPAMFEKSKQAPPPKEFFALFKWFYLFMGTVAIAGGLANLISGLCILKRRARMFSLVVAGLSCLCFPFGTALGVFTLVVLLRGSVVDLYEFQRQTTEGG